MSSNLYHFLLKTPQFSHFFLLTCKTTTKSFLVPLRTFLGKFKIAVSEIGEVSGGFCNILQKMYIKTFNTNSKPIQNQKSKRTIIVPDQFLINLGRKRVILGETDLTVLT